MKTRLFLALMVMVGIMVVPTVLASRVVEELSCYGEDVIGWMGSGAFYFIDTDPNNLDLDDKHNLETWGRWDESSYDATDPDTITSEFGTWNNKGFWFDRDGVDPWQDDSAANTGGIYEIVVSFHSIDSTLGTMFATINGLTQGFDTTDGDGFNIDTDPAGKSFTGDLTCVSVLSWMEAYNKPDWSDYLGDAGVAHITDFTVQGFKLGTGTVTVSYGDFDLENDWRRKWYSDKWDITMCDLIVSYTVDLSDVTFEFTMVKVGIVNLPPPVGGIWVPANKFELLAPWISLASLIAVATVSLVYVKRRKKNEKSRLSFFLFQL